MAAATTVNHAPAGLDNQLTVLEDRTLLFGAAHFGFTDPNDAPANALLAVKIARLPAVGALTLNGVAVTTGQSVVAADITAGKLKYAPVANQNGSAYANFTFQVQDNGGVLNGGVDLDPTPNTLTINVTSVNDAPVGTAGRVAVLEDQTLTLNVANFGFTDPKDVPANGLLAVKLSTLPGKGAVTLSGTAVIAGQLVSAADIAAGKLKYTPPANQRGATYTSFMFQVQDNGGVLNGGVDLESISKALTIDVTDVNDAPAGTDKTVTALEDRALTLATVNFGFTDPNDPLANKLLALKISTLPTHGVLTLNGATVTAGQFIAAADISAGALKYASPANQCGPAYASFTFQVQDDGGVLYSGVNLDPTPNTLTVDVTGVNDPPAGTNGTVTARADQSFAFAPSDFGFTDPIDAPPNGFSGVKISTLPAKGSLTLNGTAVTISQCITVANLTAGNLKYASPAYQSGTAFTYFTFQVQDDGGVLNGGLNSDTTPNTLTINVAPNLDIVAHTEAELSAVLATPLAPGTVVRIAPGRYVGYHQLGNQAGTAAAPIVITALDPQNPPVFADSINVGLQVINCSYLTLKNLRFENNGDIGLHVVWTPPAERSYDIMSPSNHITVEDVTILNTGTADAGNHDGLKISGIDYFTVRNVTVQTWGAGGGSGMDIVNSQYGLIEDSHFAFPNRPPAGLIYGMTMKCGSRDIVVRGNYFDDAGIEVIQIGQDSGLYGFRNPIGTVLADGSVLNYEARNIEVYGNTIVGGGFPIMWMKSTQTYVHNNTIVMPEPSVWVSGYPDAISRSILKITSWTNDGLLRANHGRFENNLIVYNYGGLASWGQPFVRYLNDGDPSLATFTFASNAWYQLDVASQGLHLPNTVGDLGLPTAETNPVYQVDPQLTGLNYATGAAVADQVHMQSTDPRLQNVGADAVRIGPAPGDDFEAGYLGAYQTVGATAPTALVSTTAMHDGNYGLLDAPGSDWIFRDDAAAQVAAGDTVSVWLQFAAPTNGPTVDGAAYFGFGASATGNLALVASPASNQLYLLDNSGYSNTTIGSASQTWQSNHWYRLQVDWGTDGSLVGKVFDSNGTTLLQTVAAAATAITSGGIAFKSTGTYSKLWDTALVTSFADPTSAATHFALAAPSASAAGAAFSVTVTALDAANNVVPSYRGTVHFTSSDAAAILPANYTFTAGDSGVHVFTGNALKTAGPQGITATDTTTSFIVGNDTLSVTPAAADHLAFGQQPTNVNPEAVMSPAVTVRVLDAYNNVVTSDSSDEVTLTLGTNPAGGVLSGTTTTTVSGGIATFNNLSINQAGNGYTLAAGAGVLSPISSTGFNVATNTTGDGFESGNLSAYKTVGGTTPTASVSTTAMHDGTYGLVDATGSDWIYRDDAAAQVKQGDTLSVWLRFAAPTTGPSFDGKAYFGFGASATGNLALVASPASNQLYLLNNSGYTYTTIGSASQTWQSNHWYRLQVDWGTNGSLVGKVFDSNGTTLLQTVTASCTAITSGGIAFRANGTYSKHWDTVLVTSSATPDVSATNFSVAAPNASTAGAAFSVSVTALDAANQVLPSYRGTVHFASTDGAAALPADYTFTAADNGVHVFTGAALKTAGTQGVMASDTTTSSILGNATVSVTPAAADHLVYGQQPTDLDAGAVISPAITVQVLDAYNNLVTSDSSAQVTVAIGTNPAGGVLSGTTTVDRQRRDGHVPRSVDRSGRKRLYIGRQRRCAERNHVGQLRRRDQRDRRRFRIRESKCLQDGGRRDSHGFRLDHGDARRHLWIGRCRGQRLDLPRRRGGPGPTGRYAFGLAAIRSAHQRPELRRQSLLRVRGQCHRQPGLGGVARQQSAVSAE